MQSTFAGKTVLVTGANRGLGRTLVEEALKRGAKRVYAAPERGEQGSDGSLSPHALLPALPLEAVEPSLCVHEDGSIALGAGDCEGQVAALRPKLDEALQRSRFVCASINPVRHS